MKEEDLIRNRMPIDKMVEVIKRNGIVRDDEVDKVGGPFWNEHIEGIYELLEKVSGLNLGETVYGPTFGIYDRNKMNIKEANKKIKATL